MPSLTARFKVNQPWVRVVISVFPSKTVVVLPWILIAITHTNPIRYSHHPLRLLKL